MPITPTSSISKNYQALGIDEIANDIETVFTSVNALETTVNALPAAPTTTVVNISSTETTYDDGRPLVASGILAMGSSPIELLPAPGVGLYYDIEKIILEYTHVSTSYNFTNTIIIAGQWQTAVENFLSESSNTFSITKENSYPSDLLGYQFSVIKSLNTSIILTSDDSSNPTLGNGTLRAIITYTTRTFGA